MPYRLVGPEIRIRSNEYETAGRCCALLLLSLQFTEAPRCPVAVCYENTLSVHILRDKMWVETWHTNVSIDYSDHYLLTLAVLGTSVTHKVETSQN